MQRYFVDEGLHTDQKISLIKDDYFHLKKVMRHKNKDQVVIIDNGGRNFLTVIEDIENNILVTKEELENDSELDVQVTLIYALAKGEKFDLVLQKATELGVSKIVPLITSRCVVRLDKDKFNKKRGRYEKILKEASEQAQRNFIPVLDDLITINQIAQYQGDYNLVAYEQTAKDKIHGGFKEVLQELAPGQTINVIVGSEGGFAQEEIDFFNHHNYRNISLGKRILRSETAPLYILSAIGLFREVVR